MPILRFGCPLEVNFSDLTWSGLTVFDVRRIALSLLVGAILAISCAVAWYHLSTSSLPLGSPSAEDFFGVAAILILVHEALHVLIFPGAGLTSNTVIGIWPRIGSPYVQYLSPMSRNRFLLALLFPFLILSILPFMLVSAQLGPVAYLSWISVLNCIGAGSDIFIFSKLLLEVPQRSLVIESDEKIYWVRK